MGAASSDSTMKKTLADVSKVQKSNSEKVPDQKIIKLKNNYVGKYQKQ
jgi:hypothetical protein